MKYGYGDITERDVWEIDAYYIHCSHMPNTWLAVSQIIYHYDDIVWC